MTDKAWGDELPATKLTLSTLKRSRIHHHLPVKSRDLLRRDQILVAATILGDEILVLDGSKVKL